MQIKLKNELLAPHRIQHILLSNGADTSNRKAYREKDRLSFVAVCPRIFGITGVQLSVRRDSEDNETVIRPMETDGDGVFSLSLDFSEGLYYYSFIFNAGNDNYYSVTGNETDLILSDKPGREYRLLITSDDFETPDWFKGGVMYHIFVDRFFRSGKTEPRADAVFEREWNSPVSQFGEKPGDFVKNDLFYGGDLCGVANKLGYLSSLGVSVIYLSPIFKAYSNHRYDTGDYSEVDPVLGGEDALAFLIKEADKYGMKLILDGVFNHTGDDSRYFDRYKNYGGIGAYGNPASEYRAWYNFGKTDDEYDSWWGIKILPKLCHENEACRKFFTGNGGIAEKYVKMGIGGWRLDVADELSDRFLDEFRETVKNSCGDALIIGEVWENAADKIAYGKRRRYLRGHQLDSVMNYPFRTALLEFLNNSNGKQFADALTEIYAVYPKCVSDCLMNIVGTHDTERILTVLGDKKYGDMTNRELSTHKMTEAEREAGIKRLKIASAVQYTVYGVPSVFYGDEAGVEGGRDPFCRAPFPWGKEDESLISHYKKLGEIRKNNKVFSDGEFRVLLAGYGYIVFERYDYKSSVTTAVNLTSTPLETEITGRDLLTDTDFNGIVPPMTAVIVGGTSRSIV